MDPDEARSQDLQTYSRTWWGPAQGPAVMVPELVEQGP
jgi:hypothetical protein